jgi:hypothetical protein
MFSRARDGFSRSLEIGTRFGGHFFHARQNWSGQMLAREVDAALERALGQALRALSVSDT